MPRGYVALVVAIPSGRQQGAVGSKSDCVRPVRVGRCWKFIDELVQIVLDVIASRTDPFAGGGPEPEAGRWRVL